MKRAIEKGQNEIARIHAENAIRNKSQSLNLLKLSSRMESIVQRLQSAQAMKNLNKSMVSVSQTMNHAVKSMNVEQITKTMDEFEKNFEELDIQSAVQENAIQQSTGMMMPEEEVDGLMKQVADEHGLELRDQMDEIGRPVNDLNKEPERVEDDLERRFNELKQN